MNFLPVGMLFLRTSISRLDHHHEKYLGRKKEEEEIHNIGSRQPLTHRAEQFDIGILIEYKKI